MIEEFIARCRREFDYYDQVARLVAQALDSNLRAADPVHGHIPCETGHLDTIVETADKSVRATDGKYPVY